jgi:hypothetical protein
MGQTWQQREVTSPDAKSVNREEQKIEDRFFPSYHFIRFEVDLEEAKHWQWTG